LGKAGQIFVTFLSPEAPELYNFWLLKPDPFATLALEHIMKQRLRHIFVAAWAINDGSQGMNSLCSRTFHVRFHHIYVSDLLDISCFITDES
jgi:hypothetical protein